MIGPTPTTDFPSRYATLMAEATRTAIARTSALAYSRATALLFLVIPASCIITILVAFVVMLRQSPYKSGD